MKRRMMVAAVLALGVGGLVDRLPWREEAAEAHDAGGRGHRRGLDAGEEDAAPKSFYGNLGGKDGVAALVDAVKNVGSDPELKKSFAKTTGPKLEAFKKNLADQLCEATGGPCKYAGKDMKEARKGLKIAEGGGTSSSNA
ncbi:MAG: group 1 truncated hemoglobin [Polyangiaceae bacterium]